MGDSVKKEEKVDITCMRYKCKRCPKARECEEREKKDEECRKKAREKDLKEYAE